jgi:hypothetical protein
MWDAAHSPIPDPRSNDAGWRNKGATHPHDGDELGNMLRGKERATEIVLEDVPV